MQITEQQYDLYFSDEMPQPEKDLFLKKIAADRKLKKEFIRIQNAKGIVCLHDFRGDEQTGINAWTKFGNMIKRRSAGRVSLNVLKYAAAVAILIASTFYLKETAFASKEIAYNEVEVPVSESLFLTLSDGTTVYLSPHSTFKYPKSFTGKERRVILDGEAFFEVTENAAKPFIVQTNRYNIKVLGTKFNVFDYMAHAMYETTLYEGAVEIYKDDIQMTPVRLAPFEQAILKNNVLVKSTIEADCMYEKGNGIVAFESRPFNEIIKKLGLYYNINFIVLNVDALNEVYTGKFRVRDSIVDILDAMQKTNKFHYSISSDEKIVYIK